ncbi:MAG: GNAT family N-acetyltransferase, partial [Elusimicrobiales bacterium]|nr:GNAT family N-acetyltransferase [Elusimicrobiales bacterium]
MEKDIKIVHFDPFTADDALWTAFFDHSDVINREMEPEDPPLPREKRRALIKSAFEIPYLNKRIFLLFLGGGKEAVGYASVSAENDRSPSYKDNKHIGNLSLSVLPASRRRGLGSALLKYVMKELEAKEPAVKEVFAPVVLACGRAFCARLGATVALEAGSNRLYLRDVDWGMLEAWAAEGASRNPATGIVKTLEIPEADLENFCEVYTETINLAPQGDVSIKIVVTPEMIRMNERKNRADGVEQTTIYSRESDGKISGLTEIVYLKENSHKVHQMLTGVGTRYRGRGLGKLLKALMLLEIRGRYPGVKYVATGNAD